MNRVVVHIEADYQRTSRVYKGEDLYVVGDSATLIIETKDHTFRAKFAEGKWDSYEFQKDWKEEEKTSE